MIPIGDDSLGRRGTPWITYFLIAANVYVFAALQRFGLNDDFLLSWAAVPGELLSGRDIVTEGARYFDRALRRWVVEPGLGPSPSPVYLTLLSSMFMHGSLSHLGGNMLFLWVFGDNIEGIMGRRRFLLFYLVSGIAGAAAHTLAAALTGTALLTPMVGASAAISGVLGAYKVLLPNNRVHILAWGFVPLPVRASFAIGLWFFMQLAGGFFGWAGSGVAYLAHIGGYLVGWAYGAAIRERLIRAWEERRRRMVRSYW